MGLMFPKPRKRLKEARRKIRAKRSIYDRMNVDWKATEAAGFVERDSHITVEGRWLLEGKDMSNMREAVIKRDKGTCQRCGAHVSEAFGEVDHRDSKGMHQRNDHIDNLQWLCGNYTVNRCHAIKTGRETRFGEGR